MSRLIPKHQDNTYKGTLPFNEIVVYPDYQDLQRGLAAKRMEDIDQPYNDFSQAQDMPVKRRLFSRIRGTKFGKFLGRLFNNNAWEYKPENCLNTASFAITGNKTVTQNRPFAENYSKYGYKRISRLKARRGDLVQYRQLKYDGDGYEPYHAGVILQKDDNGMSVKSSNGVSYMNPIRYYDEEGHSINKTTKDLDNGYYYRYYYKNLKM